eukprot:73527_1
MISFLTRLKSKSVLSGHHQNDTATRNNPNESKDEDTITQSPNPTSIESNCNDTTTSNRTIEKKQQNINKSPKPTPRKTSKKRRKRLASTNGTNATKKSNKTKRGNPKKSQIQKSKKKTKKKKHQKKASSAAKHVKQTKKKNVIHANILPDVKDPSNDKKRPQDKLPPPPPKNKTKTPKTPTKSKSNEQNKSSKTKKQKKGKNKPSKPSESKRKKQKKSKSKNSTQSVQVNRTRSTKKKADNVKKHKPKPKDGIQVIKPKRKQINAKKKKKKRQSVQLQKDIETAKKRLSNRLSQKSVIVDVNIIMDERPTGNVDTVWTDYLAKFGNEAQNVTELQTFCKTDAHYNTLSYKECKVIFDAHTSNPTQNQDYIQRDMDSAKKRFNRRQSRKPRKSMLSPDTSWIIRKEDEKNSCELIKDNIETQKTLDLQQLMEGDSHTVQKKKQISSLFEKHMENAKLNSMSPRISSNELGSPTVSLHRRLKDETHALENAVEIVMDLGFFKLIRDNEIYSKIYTKRCKHSSDFDLFDMNNMDILSRFEDKTRTILAKVICKAIVSMPSIEIVEACNADIDDKFMEILMGYLVRSCNICILSLQSNPISDRGMMSLCGLIRRNYDVLHTIKLQNNRDDISTTVCEEMCKSLEQNEYIVKFEFEFRHYEWRDYRDRVIKRNTEKLRIMKLEIQRLRLVLKVMKSLEDDEFETFIKSFGRSKLISILFKGLLEEIKKDKIENVNRMNAIIAKIRNDES